MNPKVNYALVGLFVVIFGSALIAWIFWLGVGIEKKSYNTYVSYMFQSVAGLNTNAQVKYRGVEVGKVVSISLDTENTERVKLLMDIEEDIPIKQDSIATLATQGITGLAYIELSGGSRKAPLLNPTDEQPLPEIVTGPSLFVRLDTALSDMFVKFTTIAEEISGVSASVKILLSEGNQQSINRTLQNLEQMTSQMNTHITQLSKHIQLAEDILDNTKDATKEFPDVIKNASVSMQSVQKILVTLGKTTENFDKAVLGTQKDVSRSAAATLVQMAQLFDELQRTTQALNRLLQDFERNPNMFIFGRKVEKAGPGEQ